MELDDLTIVYREVADLIAYARNPRKNDHCIDRGAAFIKEFGFSVPMLIKSDNSIIDGHLRLKCAQKLKMKKVPCIIRDDLTPTQIKAFRLSVNRFSELADWDENLLKLELQELDNLQFDVDMLGFELNIEDDNKDKDDSSDDDQYTKKIKAPIYEIKGEKPEVSALYDSKKTYELIKQIVDSDIPEEIKNFLTLAAQRHTVFSYEKIAEYYAHAPKDVQELMENSALVIIDFDKAIENGFISMAHDLAEAYRDDEE